MSSQTGRTEHNASEKKNKRRQKKSKNCDIASKNDIKLKDNAASKGDGQKNNQAGNRDIKAAGNVWNSSKNAASSLFPNVNSKVTIICEDELLKRALEESRETAYFEQLARDPPQVEKAEKFTEESESESEWTGKPQRNRPTPELEKDKIYSSDRNNNSGLVAIENLTVSIVESRLGSLNLSSDGEVKNDCDRRSEIEPKNGALSKETPFVPAIVPKFIDQYGRIDGCTEKRLFMGKGARYKEQEYLKQLKQQEQQQQQIKGSNLHTKPQILTSNSSDPSSDASNALAQVSSKEDDAINSVASSVDRNKTEIDIFDEACGYSQDLTENSQELNSQSDVDDTQKSYKIVEQLPSQKFNPDAKEFIFGSSAKVATLTENNDVSPPMNCSIKPEALVDTSKGFSSQNSKHQSRDTSRRNYGSQSKQNSQNFGETQENSRIPEHKMTQNRQDSTRVGRPIVSGGNSNNYQQKRQQSSGISVNRGGYCANNDRNQRNEQNPRRHAEQNRGYQNKSSRDDYNSQNRMGKQKRDFPPGSRGDRNPYKWEAGQNNDPSRGSTVDGIPHKSDGDQKHDNVNLLKSGTNPLKSDGGINKNDNNKENRAHSQIEKVTQVSIQNRNINASSKRENSHAWPTDGDTKDSRQSFENLADKSEPKDFSDSASNISETPDIRNFRSRFSEPPPSHPFAMETISEPPVISPPMNSFTDPPMNNFVAPPKNPFSDPPMNNFAGTPKNSFSDHPMISPINTFSDASSSPFSVGATSNYPQITNAACLKGNLQYSPSQFPAPPAFQSPERPAMPSCACYTPAVPLEVRYANLLRNDPLLFRLLQQKEAINTAASLKFSTNPENSENPKLYDNCPNCSCNSQLSGKFHQQTIESNIENCHSEEEARAQFQMSLHSNPPLRNLVASQHPEALPMSQLENIEWNASNVPQTNIPLAKNMQMIKCYYDSAGNIYPIEYPMANPYHHAQHSINVQPRGEEAVPLNFQNLPMEVQRFMQQNILPHQYQNACGYPANSRYPQQGIHVPMPFFPPKPDFDNATMSRGNEFIQSDTDDYRENHRNLGSTGVDLNNERGNDEIGNQFSLVTGDNEKSYIRPMPIKGRARSSMMRRKN